MQEDKYFFLLTVAKEAVISYLKDPQLEFTLTEPVPTYYRNIQKGVFVTIYDQSGELRGRMGTYEPTQDNVVLEIMANAISAATKDPRFDPLSLSEINKAHFIVDILSELKRVESLEDIAPEKDGLFIKKEQKRAIVLPATPGLVSVKQQIDYLLKQADLGEYYGAELFSFNTERIESW